MATWTRDGGGLRRIRTEFERAVAHLHAVLAVARMETADLRRAFFAHDRRALTAEHERLDGPIWFVTDTISVLDEIDDAAIAAGRARPACAAPPADPE